MSCILALLHRSKNTQAIDSALVKQIAGEKEYWKEVLKRVVAVIKFLAERGLAFRGEDELLGSPHNGNCLGSLAGTDAYLSVCVCVCVCVLSTTQLSLIQESSFSVNVLIASFCALHKH